MYFCRSWFSNMVSFIYVLVFWIFYTTYFLLNFTKYLFFVNTIFFIDEKHTQWMLDTKIKLFHESISCFPKWPWNCISWNALKEKLHSVSFPFNKVSFFKRREKGWNNTKIAAFFESYLKSKASWKLNIYIREQNN